jgi:NAD(P)-dependent dehydrogenase (short-subunit alcohol dehydrogenase family)
MALALAEAGADVAISGRTRETLEEAAAEIAGATGRRIVPFVADVTSAADVSRLATEVAGGFGQVDILINNAGNNIRGSIADLSEADWDSVLDTNLKGPFLCAQAFGPDMAKRGWGRIINLGSILSSIGIPGRAPYASAKAGVTSLTRVLALEWAPHGVTVNAICPGPFGTDMNKPLLNDPVKYQEFVKNLPIGRWGELDELAGLVVLLASPASSFMTGSSIYIDGGWTAR